MKIKLEKEKQKSCVRWGGGRMEGAVGSFNGDEQPPLRRGPSESTHRGAPPSSAFLPHFQNEASVPRKRGGVD